jgi:signal transduction histidine kinase
MNGFDQMNRFVQRQLSKYSWDETEFFRQAMRLAHEAIPNTDNSDVRLIEGNELVAVATYGPDWEKHPQDKTAHYPLKPPGSTASYLVTEKQGVLVYDNIEQAPYLKRTFSDSKKLILAALEAGDNVYGVLGIRSKSTRPFPQHVRLIARLLGQQLGLYHSLVVQIRNLQKAERDNKKQIETQNKTLGDVHHQIKSPIINAHRASQGIIGSHSLPRSLKPKVECVRGLCSRVARVVRNMGMFADLGADKPIRLKKTVLYRDQLLSLLKEACEDHQSLIDPDRKLTFVLDDKSFQQLSGRDKNGKLVEADLALVEQCVNNLIDNAAKYSYERTDVNVSGGVQPAGSEFFISVKNEGFEVKPEEVKKLKQRGYRSDKAISVTGEGSGIGLWIVDEIMRAHGGQLLIYPTTNGITDFRLLFPVVKGVINLAQEIQSTASRG